MAVAALYDIHGNLPALEAVLEELRGVELERIVVGGDVFPGPMAAECLDLLLGLERPVSFLRGNGDREVLEAAADRENPSLPEAVRAGLRWEAARLSTERRETLARWPERVTVQVAGLGPVFFCHATPRSDHEIFTERSSDERVRELFAEVGAPIAVCGHTHLQQDRVVGSLRVLNAGSVGMPFGEAGAFWLLLGPVVELRRTEYDLDRAAAVLRRSRHPQAEEIVERFVLTRPSRDEMLAVYSRTESSD